MADMNDECLTEFLNGKGISLDDFKKMDTQSDEYKKAYDGYEKFSEEWKQKKDAATQNKEKDKENKDKAPTVIKEGGSAQKTEDTPAPAVNGDWKESLLGEWKEWASRNGKEIKEFADPSNTGSLSFHIFEQGANQKEIEQATEVSYNSPRDLSVKGPNGGVPSPEVFAEILKNAKANGPDIEFGENMSPSFKANLMLACLKDPELHIVNPPSAEEMKSWPKELQQAVEAAMKNAEKSQTPKQPEKENKPKEEKDKGEKQNPATEAYQKAEKAVKDLQAKGEKKFDFAPLKSPEEKAVYTAALMNVMGEDIKSGSFALDNAPSYKEVTETAKKMSPEMQKSVKGGLTSYTIHSLKNIARGHGVTERDPSKDEKHQAKNDWRAIDRNHTGLTPEQIALRNARANKSK